MGQYELLYDSTTGLADRVVRVDEQSDNDKCTVTCENLCLWLVVGPSRNFSSMLGVGGVNWWMGVGDDWHGRGRSRKVAYWRLQIDTRTHRGRIGRAISVVGVHFRFRSGLFLSSGRDPKFSFPGR